MEYLMLFFFLFGWGYPVRTDVFWGTEQIHGPKNEGKFRVPPPRSGASIFTLFRQMYEINFYYEMYVINFITVI